MPESTRLLKQLKKRYFETLQVTPCGPIGNKQPNKNAIPA
jgi:hypothetical protein